VFLVGFQLEDLHPPYGLTNPTSTEVCATDSDMHRNNTRRRLENRKTSFSFSMSLFKLHYA
jgi:hypothetical protein